jgi:hypothetical protein
MTAGIQQWFPGWYINLDGDTIHGYIFLSNQIDNQKAFRYSKNNVAGPEEKQVEASEAKGFRVKDRVYESLYMDPDWVFLRRLETGRMNMYAKYSLPENGTIHEGWHSRPITVNDEKFHESETLLRKYNGALQAIPDVKDFAEEMSRMLADDPVLSSKISKQLSGYGSDDLLNIVQEYNQQ